MTFKGFAILLAAASVAAAGCGNYSNEDLEFMAAVPTTTQLAVELPAAVNTTVEAELAKRTHDTIATVKDTLASVLGLVDGIRTFEPTSRTSDGRVWGPYPDQKHPGWSWKLVVTRTSPTTFVFELDTQGASDWLQFLTGSFDGQGGARQGSGSFTANFSLVRASGFPLDDSSMNLADLAIAYQNYDLAGSPVKVTMSIDSVTPAADGASTLNIAYEIFTDRSGQMAFTLTGNLIPGPAIETVDVNSQWLGSGAGAASLVVAAGDALGSKQTECWDSGFAATYNDKPWSPAEDVGTAADCPTLPALPPLAP